MLHFDANPNRIECLVEQLKTIKNLASFFANISKNISTMYIRPISLDHVIGLTKPGAKSSGNISTNSNKVTFDQLLRLSFDYGLIGEGDL